MSEMKFSSVVFRIAGWSSVVIFCSARTWQVNHELRIKELENNSTEIRTDVKYILIDMQELKKLASEIKEEIEDLRRGIP